MGWIPPVNLGLGRFPQRVNNAFEQTGRRCLKLAETGVWEVAHQFCEGSTVLSEHAVAVRPPPLQFPIRPSAAMQHARTTAQPAPIKTKVKPTTVMKGVDSASGKMEKVAPKVTGIPTKSGKSLDPSLKKMMKTPMQEKHKGSMQAKKPLRGNKNMVGKTIESPRKTSPDVDDKSTVSQLFSLIGQVEDYGDEIQGTSFFFFFGSGEKGGGGLSTLSTRALADRICRMAFRRSRV